MNIFFKDENPINTVANIQNILYNLSIPVKQEWINYNYSNNIYSCNLTSPAITSLFAAGKGSNQWQCTASAYGELIERLSSYFIIPREPNVVHFQDEIQNDNGIILSPFVELNSKNIKYFENNETYSSSTGLAAGNTVEEAAVQGLCELLERVLFFQFCKCQLISYGEIIHFDEHNQNIINTIASKHLTIKIYDISINNFPACFVIIYGENNLCEVRIGVAPSMSLAIERSLLEIISGYDMTNDIGLGCKIIDDNIDLDVLYYGLVTRGSSLIPIGCLKQLEKEHPNKTQNQYCFNTNLDVIPILVSILENELSSKIYMREHGFLGFPVVKIFCPAFYEPFQKNIFMEVKQDFYKKIQTTYVNIYNKYSDIDILRLYQNSLKDISLKCNTLNWTPHKYYAKLKELSLQYSFNYNNLTF